MLSFDDRKFLAIARGLVGEIAALLDRAQVSPQRHGVGADASR